MLPEPHALAGTLLVIDDDEVTLRLLKVNLERSGYVVVMTRTGAEGLEFARQSSPDLILTDALLPDLRGLQVCALLMENSRTRHIPVMLMSSQSAAHDVVTCAPGSGVRPTARAARRSPSTPAR